MTYTAHDFATLQAEKAAAVAAQAAANGARYALEQEVAELRAALKDMLAAVSPIEHIALRNMLNHFLDQVTDRVRANIINVRVTLDRAGAAPTAAGEPVSGQPSEVSAVLALDPAKVSSHST